MFKETSCGASIPSMSPLRTSASAARASLLALKRPLDQLDAQALRGGAVQLGLRRIVIVVLVVRKQDPLQPGDQILEQLQTFPTDLEVEVRDSGGVPARPVVRGDQTPSNRVPEAQENDRVRGRGLLDGLHRRLVVGK